LQKGSEDLKDVSARVTKLNEATSEKCKPKTESSQPDPESTRVSFIIDTMALAASVLEATTANPNMSERDKTVELANSAITGANQARSEKDADGCETAAKALAEAQVAEELRQLDTNRAKLRGLPLAAKAQVGEVLDKYQASVAELARAGAAYQSTGGSQKPEASAVQESLPATIPTKLAPEK
jgi:hypothetical protein